MCRGSLDVVGGRACDVFSFFWRTIRDVLVFLCCRSLVVERVGCAACPIGPGLIVLFP